MFYLLAEVRLPLRPLLITIMNSLFILREIPFRIVLKIEIVNFKVLEKKLKELTNKNERIINYKTTINFDES